MHAYWEEITSRSKSPKRARMMVMIEIGRVEKASICVPRRTQKAMAKAMIVRRKVKAKMTSSLRALARTCHV